MASKTLTILEDDLDGSEAEETVSFSLDGVLYEIDLSVKNATKLRDALALYVGSGRRVGGRATRGRAAVAKPVARVGTPNTSQMREWARKKGLDVSERGRIPATIIDAYNAAHK
jgi:hypothetical protein